MTNGDKEGFSKPSYDGRLKYYNLIEKYNDDLRPLIFMSDYGAWINSLRSIKSLLIPYIKKTDVELLDKQFKRVVNIWHGMNTNQKLFLNSKDMLENELFSLMDNLNIYAKHLWLPLKDDQEESLDFSSFESESDL